MDNAQIQFNKAINLENKGESYKAELLFKEIAEKYKKYIDMDLVYNKLGIYSYIRKDFNTAMMYFEKALNINPCIYITYKCMGLVYKEIKDYYKAIECFEKYIFDNKNDIEIIYDLADFNIQLMNWEKALNWCKKVISLDCNYKDINLCMGLVNSKLGNMKEATNFYKNQLRKTPNCVNTLNNIACLFSSMAKSEQSIEFFQDMLKNIKKEQYNYFSNYLLELNYNLLFNEEFIFNEHLRFNELLQIIPKQKFDNDLNPTRKLKIGYISADFRLHSVAYFIVSQLALYNKENFEVYCYSAIKNSDFVTEQIKSYVNEFKEIENLKDEEVFKLIVEDKIDILIDLSGHAGKNRLPVFAMKPAPIQITAIGYPNTTGIKSIDYRLTDKYCDEEGVNDKYYSEKLIRMNNSFLCYSNFEGVPEVKKTEDKDEIVFGSFNNISKITDEMIKVWCEILIKVDKSKLILKSKTYNDKEAAEEMKKRFLDNGLEEEKIELIGKHITIHDHLNSYNGIDIALDTFPYNGTTTTCEAMFMGVPVITLAGKRHASRVGVSILTNTGLVEFIAHNTEEYIQKAVELAKNKERIKVLNENLREVMLKSPLMDFINYTKELETIFRQLWLKWSNNQWEKLILSNSSVVEKIIQVSEKICKTLDEFNTVDYDTCVKDYIIRLTNEMCGNIMILFETILSLKVNDTEINELMNIINKGLNILVKIISIEDFHKIQEVINAVLIPAINRLNEKFIVK